MRQHILTAAALAIAISSQGMAQSGASRHVTEANNQTAREIATYASQDFDDARRGFIATIDSPAITNDDGTTCYDIAAWDFLDGEAPATVNPSLWRQSMLNSINGLFEVVKGKIYQIRGFDIANMTFVRSDDGWIIIDATSADGAAKAGYDLVKKHLGDYPVKAIILTHPHGDHFGGIGALIDGAPNDDYEIIVPRGFLHEAQSENIIAGVAMMRRASYMYGGLLTPGPEGSVGSGLGQALARSKSRRPVVPTDEISASGQRRNIDGVEMIFSFVEDGEAPVELMIYFPQMKAFCTAEEITHNMHNLLTPRGAKVRNGLTWSKAIDRAIQDYGDDVEVSFASHHWPTWGNKKIVELWESQRDIYRFIHDQTLHLANRGYTPNEIAARIRMPQSLAAQFSCREYYGTLSHNSKSQYQLYFGWFDGNPASLDQLPPAELGKRYVDAIGGSERVIAIAREAYGKGDYRWAATLLNNLVFADSTNGEARRLLADTYTQMGYMAESAPWRNFYLTGAQELLGKGGRPAATLFDAGSIAAMETGMMLDYCAIQIDARKAEGKTATVNLHFTDTDEKTAIILKNSVLTHRLRHEHGAQCSLAMSKADFARIVTGQTGVDELSDGGSLTVEGDKAAIMTIIDAMQEADPQFDIVTP